MSALYVARRRFGKRTCHSNFPLFRFLLIVKRRRARAFRVWNASSPLANGFAAQRTLPRDILSRLTKEISASVAEAPGERERLKFPFTGRKITSRIAQFVRRFAFLRGEHRGNVRNVIRECEPSRGSRRRAYTREISVCSAGN